MHKKPSGATTERGWKVMTGRIVGRDHHRSRRNCQDAVAHHMSERSLTLVVADGCGSAPLSEMGALFASQWVARFASEYDGETSAVVADEMNRKLPNALASVARSLTPHAGKIEDTIERAFLFTLLIARLHLETNVLTVFGCGDGVVVVDDAVFEVGRTEENAPDYIAYRVLDPARGRIRTFHQGVAPNQAWAVATDGAASLIDPRPVAPDAQAPSSSHRPPTLRALVRDVPLRNPSLLQKRLNALAAIPHLLHDDTTIALARRIEQRAGQPCG